MKKIQTISSSDAEIKKGFLQINLDGLNIKDKLDVFNEFKKHINFPDYFGENWDAFWDIITDKDFIDQDIQIFIRNYNNLFEYRDQKNIFLGMLIDWFSCDYCKYSIEIYLIKERVD